MTELISAIILTTLAIMVGSALLLMLLCERATEMHWPDESDMHARARRRAEIDRQWSEQRLRRIEKWERVRV